MTDPISKIKEDQDTIDRLLADEKLGIIGDQKPRWLLDHLFQGEDCSIGLAYANGQSYPFPEHNHPVSKEFLICAKGAFITTVAGQFSRRVSTGECVTIDPAVNHVSVPLSPDTVIVYVCVPADKGMQNVRRK